MVNNYSKLSRSQSRKLRLSAAIQALEDAGYKLIRLPGRGQSSVYEATNGQSSEKISIRTTKGRRFAFPSTNKGEEWLTLDDVGSVVVSAVDDPDDPSKIQVYKFDAAEVRKRFSNAYKARKKAGMSIRDNFGLWVSLDRDTRKIPRSVGTGLGDDFPPIAEFSIAEAIKESQGSLESVSASPERGEATNEPATIGEVVDRARHQISTLAGVDVNAVRLDLKIEY